MLEEESIAADKLWKSNGKLRSGLIYESRQSSRLKYHRKLQESERSQI